MSKIIDLKGKRFNRLLVLRYHHSNNGAFWLCKCDCGKELIVFGSSLRRKITQSCGCYGRDQRIKKVKKHGLSKSNIYRRWEGILRRCFNKNFKQYKDYGGRGIIVCDEWKNDFMNFYNWAMENGYKKELTLDRINNDGNYEPNNCRWITIQKQLYNTRKNRFITYNGETLTIREWAKKTGLSDDTISYRLKKGYNIEQILTIKAGELPK